MEGTERSDRFTNFKTILNNFFIRRKKEGISAEDFKNEDFEFMELHLEEILPLMSIEEINRANIYFHSAYLVHLKNGLKISNVFDEENLTPESMHVELNEIGITEKIVEYQLETQSRTMNEKELLQLAQIESSNIQPTRNKGPLSQSTPVSVPVLSGEPRISNPRQQKQGDIFLPDIISQINISPIQRQYSAQRKLDMPPKPIATPYIETNESPFFRNFACIEREKFLSAQSLSLQKTNRGTRKRLNVENIPTKPKKRMDKIRCDMLCSYPNKSRTDKQTLESIESFSYFALMRTKLTNEINRSCTIATGSEEENSLLQRVRNLSNILRAYSIQNQTSLEPIQISQMSITRSPITPQGILRTSFSFTPLRGDNSSFQPRMVLDHGTSLPSTVSLQRQQPLLTIPERDSSINIPFHPQDEGHQINDPFTDIPREDVEMQDGHLRQAAYNNHPQIAQLKKHISLSEPITPLNIAQEQSSNLPSVVVEDFQISAPVPHSDTFELAQECPAMNRQDNIITDAPTQPLDQVQRIVAPEATQQIHNLHFNWFEILRPRNDLVAYPREVPQTLRKKRKRRRRDRPERDEQLRNREFPTIPYNEQTIVTRVDDLEQMPPSSPTAEISYQTFSGEEHEISHLVTQYPIQIDTTIKEYCELIKRASRKLEYINWERFNSYLFNANDRFELYTNIFKQVIKNNYVAMEDIFKEGVSRLEAAKGFRFVLDLKTMGLIDIDSLETRIIGIKLLPAFNVDKY